MNDITRRFFTAIDAAKLTGYRINKDIPYISQGRISNARRGDNEIGLDVVSAVCTHYPNISATYILTGAGSPIMDVSPMTSRRVGIPLVSQYAYAGYLSGYGDTQYIESLPIIDFTPDREMTGNWLAFEVRGDSMFDGSYESYREGNIVICREVEQTNWTNSRLHFNHRDFVLIHSEGILLKRVIAHDIPHHRITIHSLNPDYPDKSIDLADVRQIFSVIEVRRNCAR